MLKFHLTSLLSRRIVWLMYRRRDAGMPKSIIGANNHVVGKASAKELLPSPIRSRWFPCLLTSVCFIFTQEDLRCARIGSRKSREGLWLRRSSPSQHQHRKSYERRRHDQKAATY